MTNPTDLRIAELSATAFSEFASIPLQDAVFMLADPVVTIQQREDKWVVLLLDSFRATVVESGFARQHEAMIAATLGCAGTGYCFSPT